MGETWEVAFARGGSGVKEDSARLLSLLAEGWEPFAVTTGGSEWTYHLRKQFGGDPSVTEDGENG